MFVFIVDLIWALRKRFFSSCRAFFMADLFFFNNPSHSISVFVPCLLPVSQLSFFVSGPPSETFDKGVFHKRGDQLAMPVKHRFFLDKVKEAVLEGEAEESINLGV